MTSSLEAQRHPESAGPLQYYRDDPGIQRLPEWQQRPDFLRGPRDRIERGPFRRFIYTGDGISNLNYADEKYILYLRELTAWAVRGGRPFTSRNVRWDRIGNYMGGSYRRVFAMEEARSSSGNPLGGFSYVDHKFLQLHIGHYTYKDLHWTATAGPDVRTILTPLTFANSHMKVARLDVNYKDRDRASVFYTRGGAAGTSNVLFSRWIDGDGDDTYAPSPVLVVGTHWQHDVKDFATFGASLLNQVMAHPASIRSSFFKGDLPYTMAGPKLIRVVVTDDSPLENLTNAKVYDIDVIVQGTQGDLPVRLTSIAADPDFDLRLEPTVSGGVATADGAREVSGKEQIVFEFAIPQDVTLRSARFEAEVANDYRIGVSQTHDFNGTQRNGNAQVGEQIWPKPEIPTEKGSRKPHQWYIDDDEQPYFTVARSNGRSANSANRKKVKFDYGMPTGQNLLSFNASANLVGLDLSGEFAHNIQHMMYPVGDNEGRRHSKGTTAYWLNASKRIIRGLDLGAEIYRLDPDYSGGYDSYRGGMSFHLDRQLSPGARLESFTHEFPLVEDNDDADQWPDEHLNEVPTSGVLYPGWPNSSAYPGLDENADNVPDIDRNENFIPDWDEAFLTYHADPPDFVYGIDFNNNGIPDFRENDDLPDYPYLRDTKGQHLFLRYERLGRLGKSLSFGFYDSEEIAGGGTSKSIYLRYNYSTAKSGLGALTVNYDLKKVEDNIANHTFIYRVPPNDANILPWINRPDTPPEEVGLYRPASPDELLMRDSIVNTLFINSKYLGFENLNIENGLLWIRNNQAEIGLEDASGLLQVEDVRTRFTLINKIDYQLKLKGWVISPKFKHRLIFSGLDSEDDARVSFSDFIPIVTADYQLTNNTQFMFGMQGIPFLPYKHWDRVDKNQTFNQTDYLAMVKFRAEYFGIRDNTLFVGYQRSKQDFSRAGQLDTQQTTIFVELISPF
jgi:hypothetical protein